MHAVEIVLPGDFYDTVANKSPEEYRSFKERVSEALIRRGEKVIPGLSEHIVVRDTATPLTFERYSGSTRGAWYGWGATPKGLTSILPQKTPFRGLFLCGQWANPGGGVPTVMLSGKILAGRLLGTSAR